MRGLADERPHPFDQRADLGQYLVGTQRLLPKEDDDAVCLFEVAFDPKF